MCIIIHRAYGSNVPNDVLEHNRKKNPDGFGLAWRDNNGSLHYRKYAPTAYSDFHAALKAVDRDPKIEYVAHYRFATHGPACERLSHPFPYEDEDGNEVLVFHNGIINIQTPAEESDTSHFVNRVLASLPSGWWRNPAMRFLVENAIGGSRLLVMTKDETVRFNERYWTDKGGIMYSTDPGPYKSSWLPKGAEPKPTTPSNIVKYTPPKQWTAPEPKKGKKKHRHETKSYDSRNFGFTDADDDVQGWRHMGHWVESLDTEFLDPDSGEDKVCAVICVDCQNTGEVYVIDGTVFIDVSHGVEMDDNEDLDALTMQHVYAN